MPAESLPFRPAVLVGLPSSYKGMLPYQSLQSNDSAASVMSFSPDTFLAQIRLTSELLRTL